MHGSTTDDWTICMHAMSPAVYDAACPFSRPRLLGSHWPITALQLVQYCGNRKAQAKPHLLLHAPQPCEHILRLSGKRPRFLALREEVVELLQRPAWDLKGARVSAMQQAAKLIRQAPGAVLQGMRQCQLGRVSACATIEYSTPLMPTSSASESSDVWLTGMTYQSCVGVVGSHDGRQLL